MTAQRTGLRTRVRHAPHSKEARAAAALSHPHICSVYEVERDNSVDYIVMELLDGRPLSDVISGGLSVSTAVRYGVQIADPLAHAHARGVFRGDGAYTGLTRYYLGQRTEAESLLESLGAQPRAQAALASCLAARGDRKRASA